MIGRIWLNFTGHLLYCTLYKRVPCQSVSVVVSVVCYISFTVLKVISLRSLVCLIFHLLKCTERNGSVQSYCAAVFALFIGYHIHLQFRVTRLRYRKHERLILIFSNPTVRHYFRIDLAILQRKRQNNPRIEVEFLTELQNFKQSQLL